MAKFAFIFPGQGAQYVGMAKDFYENSESAKSIFAKFNDILGKDLSNLCFEGPETELGQTINTQPAILATSIIALDAINSQLDIKPAFVAGHSLGEYSAMYAAGVLSLEDVINLVKKRAELMQNSQVGTMTAVIGLTPDKIEELITKSSAHGVISVANYNTPEQTVITGEDKAVEFANSLAVELGAKRVVPLSVSGAFHSPLMKTASEQYQSFVTNATINDANIPVVTNVDAKETTSKDEFAQKMVSQIYSSVHWTQTIKYLIDNGVDTFIEIGPGKVLTGMMRKIDRSVKAYNVSDIESLNKLITQLNSEVLV